MKNRFSFAVAIWWVLACLIAGIFLMATSDKESRISESENRMLAGFPKLSLKTIFNDEFTGGFESFLSDGFFARDAVVGLSNDLVDTFSVLSDDEIIAMEAASMESDLQSANLQVEGNETEDAVQEVPGLMQLAEEEADMPLETDDAEEEEVIVLAEGELPINEEHSYLYFEMTDGSVKRIYTYDKDKIDYYADTLRIMQGYLPADGNILFTQVPLASIANRWVYQQDEYAGWGSTVEMMLEDSLQGTERIHVFSTYDILEPYVTGETPMFYYGDHHWSAEGAYKVFAEMIKKLGMPLTPYEEYEYKHIISKEAHEGKPDIFNVLYPLLPAQSLRMVDTGVFEVSKLMNYDSTTYRSFMGGTQLPWRKILTGANSGRKALVLCDSFGNAFTPYLFPYYDEVHMADFRNGSYSKEAVGGSMGQMMQQYGIDDVYIITSTANGLRKENSIIWLREYLQ